VLIGSMNPEEGTLRPQILDRFGLRVLVQGLADPEERMLVYERVRQFRESPRSFIRAFEEETFLAYQDVIAAQELLPSVKLSDETRTLGMQLVQELSIHSHRAEFTLFEAARAYAAADARQEVTLDDLQAVAPMALRMRRSSFIDEFIGQVDDEDRQIGGLLTGLAEDGGA
jgi:magnesium chelatase subunit I